MRNEVCCAHKHALSLVVSVAELLFWHQTLACALEIFMALEGLRLVFDNRYADTFVGGFQERGGGWVKTILQPRCGEKDRKMGYLSAFAGARRFD